MSEEESDLLRMTLILSSPCPWPDTGTFSAFLLQTPPCYTLPSSGPQCNSAWSALAPLKVVNTAVIQPQCLFKSLQDSLHTHHGKPTLFHQLSFTLPVYPYVSKPFLCHNFWPILTLLTASLNKSYSYILFLLLWISFLCPFILMHNYMGNLQN